MKNENKMNNKGFSLVELIIVIAIMAILAAALAPQLMKYVEKSRKSTDASTCGSLESSVNAALALENVYEEVVAESTVTVKVDAATGVTVTPIGCTDLLNELKATITKTSNPKVKDGKSFQIVITTDANGIKDVAADVYDSSGKPLGVRES